MKVTFNFRGGIGPLTLDLEGDEDTVLARIKDAIRSGAVLDLTDTKGDRVVISSASIGYVISPTSTSRKVGFGRV